MRLRFVFIAYYAFWLQNYKKKVKIALKNEKKCCFVGIFSYFCTLRKDRETTCKSKNYDK